MVTTGPGLGDMTMLVLRMACEDENETVYVVVASTPVNGVLIIDPVMCDGRDNLLEGCS